MLSDGEAFSWSNHSRFIPAAGARQGHQNVSNRRRKDCGKADILKSAGPAQIKKKQQRASLLVVGPRSIITVPAPIDSRMRAVWETILAVIVEGSSNTDGDGADRRA